MRMGLARRKRWVMATRKKTQAAGTVVDGESRPSPTNGTGLEKRIDALEQEVHRLRVLIENQATPEQVGWRRIVGSFANDPAFDEAMRLGREWRKSVDRRRRPRKVKSSDDRA
jgi:hypothetical protein